MALLAWTVIIFESSFLIPYLRISHTLLGVTFSLPGKYLWIIYLISVFVNLILLFWIHSHKKCNSHFNKINLQNKDILKALLLKKNAIKTENLLDIFNSENFTNEKDIYYINNCIILKSTNIIDNGIKKYPGFYLKISPAHYWFLKSHLMLAYLDREIFVHMLSQVILVIITFIAIYKLLILLL